MGMEQESTSCPVCTLYLREGITLQSHLETHPKDKVIEALLRLRNVNSTSLTPKPAEEHLHGQSCVARNSGTVIQTKTCGSSQTQVTATVSYQHFVTTNASTVIPQYIQVVAPNSSPPLVPNPAFALMPHLQPAPYVPTMYNPLYNPYIPHPYPLVHPIYTNMPFSSDVNSLMSTSQVTSPVIAPSTSPVKSPVIAPSTSPIPSTVITTSTSQVTNPVIAPSTSQVANPVIAPSTSQVTSPVIAPSTSQVTSPVIAPSISPIPSTVIAPSSSPVKSPVIAPSTSPVKSPVIAPSISPIPSTVIAPSSSPVKSPVIAPYSSPVQSPVIALYSSPIPSTVIAPSISPIPSTVIAPSSSPVKSSVIAPSTSPIPSPVIAPSTSPVKSPVTAPSTSQATSTVIAPSTSPIPSTVIAPSSSPVKSPVIAPSISPIPSTVIAPSSSPVKSPVIAPSISPIPSPVIAPSISPIPSPVIAPSTSQVTNPVIAPSISPIPSTVIAPSISPIPTTVIAPSISQVTNPVIAPSTSPVKSSVIAPSTSPIPSTVIAPSISQVTNPVIAPSTSPVKSSVIAPSTSPIPSTVIAPSSSPVKSPVIAPSISPIPSTVIAPSISPIPTTVIAPSISQVTNPVIAPSTSPVKSSVIAPSTSPIPSTVIAPSTSQVTNPVIAPSISPIPSTVIAPSTSQVTNPVIAPSISPIPSTVIAPSISPIPTTVIAPSISPIPSTVIAPSISPIPSPVISPSTCQTVPVERLDPVLKQASSIATNTSSNPVPGRRKSKKLPLNLRLNSRSQSRLNLRSQRIFKWKKHLGCRKGLTASSSSVSLPAILTSRSATDVSNTTNTAANTSVIAKAKSSRFESKPISSPKTSNSASASVITQIPMPLELIFRSRSPSEASHSPICSPDPTPPPSVPLPSPATNESDEIHLDPEDSNIKSEFEQNSQHAADVSEYPVTCERAASSCSVITDRNNAVPFSGNTYINGCSMYENISDSDSQNGSPLPQLPCDEEANTRACDQQPEISEKVSENFKRNIFGDDQDRLSEYNGEIPKKMFRPYEMEQEEKASFNFDFGNQEAYQKESNTDREKISCESGEFAPEESLPSGIRDEEPEDSESELIDNLTRGRTEGQNPTLGVKKLSSVIFLRNSSGSNSVTPLTERTPPIEGERDFSDRKTVTYTDLQPATDNSVLGGFGMASCLNINNYMEVDGVKIFLSAGNEQNRPLEPIIKFSTSKVDEPKVQDFVKPEKERETLVESVIHLVSVTTPKSDFSGETFNASTSENNSEVRDLSPLSLNIRADESMPARGELSEQESLGAENTTWNLFRAEIITKSERDLMSGNEFRATILDIEDGDEEGKSVKGSFWRESIPYLKKENSDDSTEDDDKSKKETPRKSKVFYCPQCEEKFRSLRSRRKHLSEIHFYDFKKEYEITPSNETKQEPGIISKTDLTETKSESDTMAAITEQFIKDNLLVKKPSSDDELIDRSSSCEIARLCPECHIPFMGLKKLKEHLREVHGSSKFKCEDCYEIFEGEKEYNIHLQVHPLKCKQCGKSFIRRQSLKLHAKRHLTIKPHACSQCPKTFVTRQKLDEHLNGHAGLKPLKCLSCDKTFSRHSNLIQHKKLHHNCIPKKKVKDFVCRCGEVFHSASKLTWHKEVHEAKPKTCPFCSQKFIHKNSVTRHVRRSHLPHYLPYDKKDTDNIQCPICGKIYLRSSLLVHMRVHSGEKPFACNVCTKRFTTKWNMEVHNWTHQSRNNMPFRCLTCKRAFYRETDYKAHMNSHKNVKPYTCNICGQKFVRKYNCIRHEEEHGADKKYFCTVAGCDKSFHRSYYLRDHLRVHTGARPHTCHICGKSSSTKSNHNKHIRTHDTREPLNTEN